MKAQVNAEQTVNVGRNAMYFDDYVVAIQYFNRAISAKPYLAKPYVYRAIAKLNLEDYTGAADDATKAVDLNPFLPDAWEVRGVALQNLGRDSLAAADYEKALDLLPGNRQISFNLAGALVNTKQYDRADSVYADLIAKYPHYSNAMLGLANLNLARGDTAQAIKEIDRALGIDSLSFNAHAMRADIALRATPRDTAQALRSVNSAIKLQPRVAGLYINRSALRYDANDWFGAMSDLDYAVELEPANRLALFNRGLLEMEVGANDKALTDMTRVLQLDPEDVRARYNRAVIYGNKHMYNDALADVEYVIAAFPDFPTGYWMRSEYLKQSGRRNEAMRDYDKARAMSKALKPSSDVGTHHGASESEEADEENMVRKEFQSLLTVADNTDQREEYNNTAIRGRIQDRNVNIVIEPAFELTYYADTDPSALSGTHSLPDVDRLNSMRILRQPVIVSNHAVHPGDSATVQQHFASIDYYTSYLATHTPRAIDYVGRALDQLTVHNYEAAIADLTRAIALSPDFAPAYMLRAQAYAKTPVNVGTLQGASAAQGLSNLQLAVNDYREALRIAPNNPYAWYDIGNIYVRAGDNAAALDAYNQAIDLKHDLAPAYFNRGYLRLQSGDRRAGVADLSRAGELGIPAAYNLIKRISR